MLFRSKPEDLDAHVIAGLVDLVRGDDEAAERHARFALTQDSTDRDALQLWASIKARRSWTLGLWWRFNAWISASARALRCIARCSSALRCSRSFD